MPSEGMTNKVDALYEATRDWFANVSQNLDGLGRARRDLDAAITSLERERDEAVRLREHEAQLRTMLTDGWERQVRELTARAEKAEQDAFPFVAYWRSQYDAAQSELDSINTAMREGEEAEKDLATRWPEAVEKVRAHYIGDQPVNAALDEVTRLATEKGDAT